MARFRYPRKETSQWWSAWAAEAFSDLEVDVRQSMQRIRNSPFIPHRDQVRGFIFDVATGLLQEVS